MKTLFLQNDLSLAESSSRYLKLKNIFSTTDEQGTFTTRSEALAEILAFHNHDDLEQIMFTAFALRQYLALAVRGGHYRVELKDFDDATGLGHDLARLGLMVAGFQADDPSRLYATYTTVGSVAAETVKIPAWLESWHCAHVGGFRFDPADWADEEQPADLAA